jgi:3-hydroxyacyl-[acyl-carrier-protein] dehydratase
MAGFARAAVFPVGCAPSRRTAMDSKMTETGCTNPNPQKPPAGPARYLAAREDAALREALKRCSRCTYIAAYQFRLTGDPDRLPTLVLGIIERYVEPGLRSRLGRPDTELLLREDLGIDSLDQIEIVGLLEDVLQIGTPDLERPVLQTLADVRRYAESRTANGSRPIA